MRYLLCLGCMLMTQPALAGVKVYRCADADGKVRFQDGNCRMDEDELKVDVKDPSRPIRQQDGLGNAAAGAERKVTRDQLLGYWCEFGVSSDGQKIHRDDDPAIWHFKDYGNMSYSIKSVFQPSREIFNDYKLDGEKIRVKNPLIGTWEVGEFTGNSMVLENAYGYLHMKKGMCF